MTPSLLIVPDRYKAAKLYSQLPESGAGDFTVTRGTTATRVNASGLIESVASGVPRIDYTGGGCGKLLVEPAATNLVLQSQTFETTWSPQTASITANNTTAPDGTLTADKLVATVGLGTSVQHRIDQTTTSAAGNNTFSVYAKKGEIEFIFLRIGLSGAIFNLNNGVITSVSAGIVPTFIDAGNGWYRLIVNKAAATANEVLRINLNQTPVFTDFVGNGTDGAFLWGAQYETGSVATSYIPTVAATVTRNADVISLSSASGLIGQASGTIYAEVDIQRDAIGAVLVIDDGDTTDFISISKTATRQIRAQIRRASGSITTIITSSALSVGMHKIALGYTNGDYALYIDGVSAGTSTNSTNYPATALTQVVLSNTNYGPLNDRMSAAALYPTRLTNATLASLTTL